MTCVWLAVSGAGTLTAQVVNPYLEPGACSACHAGIATRYARTGMARSFGIVPAGDPQIRDTEFKHDASNQRFAIFQHDGKHRIRRSQSGVDGSSINVAERTLDYWLGSGNHARGYISKAGAGALVELPLTWYSEKGGHWGMSPAYDQAEHAGFSRKISYRCMFCHNAYPDFDVASGDSMEGSAYPGKLPEGIDCQRCHGPGRNHVQTATSRGPIEAIRKAIVNPRRLPRDRQDEVCLQCHLDTTSSKLPAALPRFGRGVFSYRPGEPLEDYILHFDHAPGAGYDDKFEFASSAYRLRKSACFTASREMLACTTCHDPHEPSNTPASMARYTRACQGCHRTAISKLVRAQRHPSSQDCVSCHMPKRRPTDAIHVSITDHNIQRRPPGEPLGPLVERNDSNTRPYRGEVVLYYPPELAKTPGNELYLAIAQVKSGANLENGLRRLEAAIAKDKPQRGEFYFELAEAYRQAGRLKNAVGAYEEAVSRDNNAWRFYYGLGNALAAVGALDRSGQALRRASELAPRQAVVVQGLAQTLTRQGKLEEAVAVLKNAVPLDPDSAETLNSLGTAWMRLGNVAEAEKAFREAVRLRPELAAMRNNFGAALIRLGKVEEAIGEYRAALVSRPESSTVHYNLAVVLAQQGRLPETEESLRNAIRFAPNYFEAHLKLGQILAARGAAALSTQHLNKASESPDPLVRNAARESLSRGR